jgi:hypothetical protein
MTSWEGVRISGGELAVHIGDFQARLLLTVFYFTVLTPFGLMARFVIDPLALRRPHNESAWVSRIQTPPVLSSARRQF